MIIRKKKSIYSLVLKSNLDKFWFISVNLSSMLPHQIDSWKSICYTDSLRTEVRNSVPEGQVKQLKEETVKTSYSLSFFSCFRLGEVVREVWGTGFLFLRYLIQSCIKTELKCLIQFFKKKNSSEVDSVVQYNSFMQLFVILILINVVCMLLGARPIIS